MTQSEAAFTLRRLWRRDRRRHGCPARAAERARHRLPRAQKGVGDQRPAARRCSSRRGKERLRQSLRPSELHRQSSGQDSDLGAVGGDPAGPGPDIPDSRGPGNQYDKGVLVLPARRGRRQAAGPVPRRGGRSPVRDGPGGREERHAAAARKRGRAQWATPRSAAGPF